MSLCFVSITSSSTLQQTECWILTHSVWQEWHWNSSLIHKCISLEFWDDPSVNENPSNPHGDESSLDTWQKVSGRLCTSLNSKVSDQERHPYRHDDWLAPELPDLLILLSHSSYQWGKKHQPSFLCCVTCSVTRRWVIKGHIHPYGFCSAAARTGGMAEGPCGKREEAHILCGSPDTPQLCDSTVTAATPLPHLSPSILGCRFIRTALQLFLWAPHPSRKTKETRNFYGIW